MKNSFEYQIRRLSRAMLLSVSYVALGAVIGAQQARAQSAPAEQRTSEATPSLPPVTITAPEAKRRASRAPTTRADNGTRKRQSQTARRPEPTTAPKAFTVTQDARTGTVGVYANSTSVATKTNTPLVNIPQSLSVITKDFIRDQAPLNLTDVTRYVPGVAVHQGEGNRDELVIRGVDSSANFFVNGFRDDVQYFRDLYNAQSVEVLKGPAALTFGRGAGGGVLNRTLKEADGVSRYDASIQTGSWNDRRFTLDAGKAVNISTTTASPTAAIPRRRSFPGIHRQPASIRPRRSRRTATSPSAFAAPRSTWRSPPCRPAWPPSSMISKTA
jgi:catecholate siderophore receptor